MVSFNFRIFELNIEGREIIYMWREDSTSKIVGKVIFLPTKRTQMFLTVSHSQKFYMMT